MLVVPWHHDRYRVQGWRFVANWWLNMDRACWHITYETYSIRSWWHHQMETFSALLALCAGNSPASVNSPHKGQWRGALMFSLICAWINGWVNNREAGDLRRHRAHYVMLSPLFYSPALMYDKCIWWWSMQGVYICAMEFHGWKHQKHHEEGEKHRLANTTQPLHIHFEQQGLAYIQRVECLTWINWHCLRHFCRELCLKNHLHCTIYIWTMFFKRYMGALTFDMDNINMNLCLISVTCTLCIMEVDILQYFLYYVLMAQCQTAVTPLLTHLSYCSLALSHRSSHHYPVNKPVFFCTTKKNSFG